MRGDKRDGFISREVGKEVSKGRMETSTNVGIIAFFKASQKRQGSNVLM